MKRIDIAVLCAWFVALVLVIFLAHGDGHAYSSRIASTRGLGYITLFALVLALSVTPAAVVVRRVTSPSRLRRALGLAAVGGGWLHAVIALTMVPGGVASIWREPPLRAGLLALLILLLLGVTSFPALVRRLHLQHWKELHRLAYVALVCALWHAMLQPFAPALWLLALAGVCTIILALRLWPRRD